MAKLFSDSQLEEIKKEYENWEKNTLKGDVEGTKLYYTHSGIPVKLVHTPLDIPDFDYLKDLGFPGQAPYVRGVYPNMYRGRLFTVRQLAGFGSPQDLNKRLHFLLSHGATGVNILFDLPTIRGYDSDDPKSEGNVGMCGTCVDTIDDIKAIYEGIPIEKFSSSIVTHLPSTSTIILPMYISMAKERGVDWKDLAGTTQNDFIMETTVGSAPEIIPPRHSFRIQCDVIEFCAKHLPRWNPISYNGYNLREAGTDAVLEVAVAIANAIETAQTLIDRGLEVDAFARRMSFFWDFHNDFFEEIAKCRASRRVWYRIMKDRFKAKNPRSYLMRFHIQTAGITLPATEPLNNIARSAIQGLGAVLGGCQSLHIDSYDEAYSVPTEEAALVSLRTQQIIQVETGIVNTVDPLAGSYYVEYLTNQMEERIMEKIEEIEKMGGLVAAVESGWLAREIAEYAYRREKAINEGTEKIVGLNYLRAEDVKPTPIEIFKYDYTVEERKIAELKKLKKERNNDEVKRHLDRIRKACHTNDNLTEIILEAVPSKVTLGEIENVFREEFGLWQFPLI